MMERKTYPAALLHAMPRAQMFDNVSHEAYAGVGQVRAIDGRNAYVMYVDEDTVEGYWLPRHELTVHESTKE